MDPLLRTLRAATLVGCALLWFLTLRPATLGGPATYLLVAGGSMEPTLRSGDLVVALAADAYAIGDVVAFRADGGLVVHRIVGGSAADGLVTRGDNRDREDHWRPTEAEIVGRLALHVPAVGTAVRALARPPIPALAAAIVTFAVVVTARRPQRSSEIASGTRP
jgi:signal peptidase